DQIGRILDALDACGQANNPMVVFTSDHGDMLGAHRMWIKSWMPYEEVYRMPLVIRVPGAKPGVCDRLVQTHDIPHTFLDLLGLSPLPYADGRSLRPLLQNPKSRDWDDTIMCVGYGCEFFVTQRLLITANHKYVFNGFDQDELYDLKNDPGEMHNRINDAAYSVIRSELRGKLYDLMNRFGDPYGDVGGRGDRYGAPRYLPRS
ncbi:MAG: sulfatase-like hydrolase/transferase, partial [Kiritimatiellae bacterium]|nr:sulfatase-like hydrolase/transferase [Kiritimatiellia bacterium]